MKLSNVLLAIIVLFTAIDIWYTGSFGTGAIERGTNFTVVLKRMEVDLARMEANQMLVLKALGK